VYTFLHIVSQYDQPPPPPPPPCHRYPLLIPFLYFQTDNYSPLGLVKKGPYGTPVDNFRHYRGVEVKHGRIAMAATLGMLVQQTTRFEGSLSPSANLDFKDVPNGLAALSVVPLAGWVQMAVLIGVHEVLVKERPNRAPGDFGTGYFGVALDDQSATQLRALSVEVSNGRLAMLGILGMFASEVIHGEALSETQIFG
jgi:light-harvesting complex I chlorophyll a/b binding protein 1